MAVYTKISPKDINLIERDFSIGKIYDYIGVKKGIENTNYIIKTKNKKYILTIFEKRVDTKDLPFFMKLMSGLVKYKIKCPLIPTILSINWALNPFITDITMISVATPIVIPKKENKELIEIKLSSLLDLKYLTAIKVSNLKFTELL